VVVADLRHESRWPQFTAQALEAGVRSVLSLRLFDTGDRAGALTLLSTRPHAFDTESRQVGSLLARHAALALAAAHEVEQLQRAVATRDVIGQAKGMLMERHGLDADRAFAVLVRYSRDSNTRLRDVAEAVVTTRSLPDPG
jgi:GAF domain-containing protein